MVRVPVYKKSSSIRRSDHIIATIFKPIGKGPFPLVVVNHGSDLNAVDDVRPKRFRFIPQSREFVNRGFAVIVPTRRGYGDSEGQLAESYDRGDVVDFHRLGLETALDIEAAIDFMRGQPYVDSSCVIVIGHSAGGYGCLALGSRAVEGLRGLINFGGIRGSRARDKGSARAVITAVGKYGETSRIPSLWIYSENDSIVGPSVAAEMHQAYTRSGGMATFIMMPPFGRNGHYVFTEEASLSAWLRPVDQFLGPVISPGSSTPR